MTKFKEGDKVRVVSAVPGSSSEKVALIGQTFTINFDWGDTWRFPYDMKETEWCFSPDEIEPVEENTNA
jgi:hypothetical protein